MSIDNIDTLRKLANNLNETVVEILKIANVLQPDDVEMVLMQLAAAKAEESKAIENVKAKLQESQTLDEEIAEKQAVLSDVEAKLETFRAKLRQLN